MMKRRDGHDSNPDLTSARDALRQLPAVRADGTFRSRLKELFVSGRIAERQDLAPERPRRRRNLARWILPAAAAAGLLLALGVLNRGPNWMLVASRGEGKIIADGHPLQARDAAQIAKRLRAGTTIRLEREAEMEILCANRMVVQLTPGTEMTVPGVPGRWFARNVRTEVHGGEARITTGPGFRGARLRITTLEVEVQVSGTTLAVIRDAASTCVCAYDGELLVGPRGGTLKRLATGWRRILYNDGRPEALLPIDDMENAKLGMFQDQARPRLEPAAR